MLLELLPGSDYTIIQLHFSYLNSNTDRNRNTQNMFNDDLRV